LLLTTLILLPILPIIHTSSAAKIEWNRTYGGKSFDAIESVIAVPDGFVLAGSTYSFGDGSKYSDAWLIKTDKEGKELWKLILRSGIATSLVKVEDGFVVAGYDYSDKSAWLVKVKVGEESGFGFGIKAGIAGLAALALVLILIALRRRG